MNHSILAGNFIESKVKLEFYCWIIENGSFLLLNQYQQDAGV